MWSRVGSEQWIHNSHFPLPIYRGNFYKSTHDTIVRPWGRDIGCLLWDQGLPTFCHYCCCVVSIMWVKLTSLLSNNRPNKSHTNDLRKTPDDECLLSLIWHKVVEGWNHRILRKFYDHSVMKISPLTHEYPTIQVTSSCHMATKWHPFLLGFMQGHSSYRWSEKEGSALYTWTIYQVVLLLMPIFQPISLFDMSRFAPTIHTNVNSSDAGDRIFRLWGSIPCLLMPWLLKSP